MAEDLQGDAELTITGFLIGFCIAQLIWGPITDRYGRRLSLFIGLILFITGSVGCALSTDNVQIADWVSQFLKEKICSSVVIQKQGSVFIHESC